MKFFSGEGTLQGLGTVTALPAETFEDLCRTVISQHIRLRHTRKEFFALEEKNKEAPMDQMRAKRARYVTPATFKTSPSPRNFEHADRCNLIALDIDDATEAKRLLTQRWGEVLHDLGFAVWHTLRSTAQAPRLRLIVSAEGIPVARYVQAARTIAEMVGMSTINSGVTFHAVQPMFLPTQFADDVETRLVAMNAQGEPFLIGDITEDDETRVDAAPLVQMTGDVADLAFLRSPLTEVTLPDAAGALQVMDPDMGMQQWIEVAAALKHQFPSQEQEAYQLWDAWSAKGKKYVDSAETKYRWGSLKAQPLDRAPVTIRTLFKWATARGWANPTLAAKQLATTTAWLKSEERSTEQLLDEGTKRIAKIGPAIGQLERKSLMITLRDRLSARGMALPLPDIRKAIHQIELETAKTTGIPSWAKGICYVTALNVFYRYVTDRQFTPEVLDLMYALPQIGEDKPPRPREYLMQVLQIPQVENLRYDPTQGEKRFITIDNVPFVNTYRATYAPPEPERADEAGEVYLDHVAKLIREPEHQRTLTDFLAYQHQFPGRKVRWAPLIQGAEGCGKTAFAVMLKATLGRGNVAKLRATDVLEGKHNDWAYGRQVVAIEEIRVIGSNRHAVMDKLKPLITDDDIGLHRKFESHVTVDNVTNYLLFTNYHDALAVNDDGRRYFVLSSPLQNKGDIAAIGGQRHFDRLYKMIRTNAGGLRAWFLQWKLSAGFDPEGRAPVTKYLYELAENSASPLASAVKYCIEDEPHPLVRRDLLSLGCLRGCLDGSHLPDFSDQALAAVLRELGWEKHSRQFVGGAKHQLWVKGLQGDVRNLADRRMKIMEELY